MIYKSHWYFLPSFKLFGLSVQENKHKIHFQDSGHGGYFGFPIILAIFDVQIGPIFLISLESIGPLVQEKKSSMVAILDFQS